MNTLRTIVAIIAVAWLQCGCSDDGLEQATMVEGRGVEPHLTVVTTTVSQARMAVGAAANEPSTTGNETTIEAGPFRLIFVTPETGGEPVLQALRTARIPNPRYPRW